MADWDGQYPPPFAIYSGDSLLNLIDLRDNKHYRQDYREKFVHQLGWNSWQEIMDAGLATAELPEQTHCPECGRPYEEEDG